MIAVDGEICNRSCARNLPTRHQTPSHLMLDETTSIIRHDDIGSGYSHLVLDAPRIAEAVSPGQFVHVMVQGLEKSALRRPFSVFNAEDGKVEILYKRVGRGTAALNAAKVGETIRVLGPLGKGFPCECKGRALLVGGGYGVAPLYFLSRRLGAEKAILFVGGRTKADLLALDRFAAIGIETRIATNDGSLGEKGFVTCPLDEEISRLREKGECFEFFTCGPDGLLKAVCERALALGVPGWISVDRHMICGVGACYACIQKTVHGNARCCVDGPVFPAKDLVW